MILGRVDDVLNVAGHRLGTMEIESALVAHPAVAEAAVVGRPDPVKGEAIVAFVTLKEGHTPSDALKEELRAHVAKVIGPIARPDEIRFTDALPKTRSGKIMRRLLRQIAAGEKEIKGDTSTLRGPLRGGAAEGGRLSPTGAAPRRGGLHPAGLLCTCTTFHPSGKRTATRLSFTARWRRPASSSTVRRRV